MLEYLFVLVLLIHDPVEGAFIQPGSFEAIVASREECEKAQKKAHELHKERYTVITLCESVTPSRHIERKRQT